MLELYNAAVSTCSQKVRLVLAEKGLDWVDRRINFARRDHLSDWYLRLNPNGVVPTLVDDGTPIVDSSVISEYLDEKHPDVPLRPQDLKRRAQMRAWRQFLDEVPTVAIRAPSFNAHFVKIWAELSSDEFRAYTDRLPLRKHFYRKMTQRGFDADAIEESRDRLSVTLDRMERALADGPWLLGDAFTLADVSVVPTIVRMEDLGMQDFWVSRPHVADWYERVQARPAFAKAYYSGSRDLSPDC